MAMMEKPNHLQKICATNAAQFQALKCPRCDSSNTKFCYYNNYSLTQPRHFCKACKRYWTRGGTLRNVPVGGSCRKNRRIRRPPNNHNSTSSSLAHDLSLRNSSNPTTNLPSTTTQMENPFLDYTLPSNSDLVNLLYPNPTRFGADLGLGFSPMGNHSFLSSYISTHNRPVFSSSTGLVFDQPMKPFTSPVSDVNGMNMLKTDQEQEQEQGPNRSEWNYQLAQIMESSDSSLYNWNASSSIAGSSWLDPQNIIGSNSVPSLI